MSDEQIIKVREELISDFRGTIIDIETIGEFCQQYGRNTNDSRRCQNIQQVILGFINEKELCVLCAKGNEAISDLKTATKEIIEVLKHPFYAFNADFESSVWFHCFDKKIIFDGELNREKYERKADAVRSLRIQNYQDPFCDNGYLCMKAWEKGDFSKAIAHNRACLLKERDILLKRGYRKPNVVSFNK